MSDVQRRIVMLWDSRGAAQVRASIGQMQTGLSSYRRELRMAGDDQSYLNKQMRAFGTTFRYAIAGGTIFGTVNAIRTLGDFQAKLGEISAVASGPGFDLTGQKLDDLGNRLLKLSTDTATPISNLQEGILNLYSTIGEVPEDEAVNIMGTVAKVARTSQADINDTTQALLGLINAFGEGTDAIPKFGDEFFKVVQLSAGGVDFARTYAQQLGKLSQTANLGQFTPEQSMALAIASSRFGGSTATNLRGLAQLQRTIITPSAKPTEEALAAIGLPLRTRQRLGGWETLMRILQHANQLGVQGAGRTSTTLVEELGDAATNQDLGISGAGSSFLAKIFTRAESRNMASIFSQLMTPNQVEGTKNMTLNQYLQEVKDSAGAVDTAMDKAMNMRRIQQAGTAMQNFSLAFANAWNPLIQPAATGITAGSSKFQKFASDNPYAVMGITGAIGAALIGGRRFGALRAGGRALPMAGAAADALQGGQMRGDSPLNPLYVVVVSQLVGGPGFRIGRNQFPGGVNYPENMTGRARDRAIRQSTQQSGGRLSRMFGGKLAGAAGSLAAYFGLDAATAAAGGTAAGAGALAMGGALAMMTAAELDKQFLSTNDPMKTDISAFPRLNRLRNRVMKNKIPLSELSPVEADAYRMMMRGLYHSDSPGPRLKAAESMMDKAVAAGGAVKVHGQATVTVNLDETDAKGNVKTRKSVKVPVPLFGEFTAPAPQTGGKNKTTRG